MAGEVVCKPVPDGSVHVLPDQQKEAMEYYANEIRGHLCRSAQELVEAGRLLQCAKKDLPHGQWLDWLRREFNWTDRTARRLLQVAECFKSDNVVRFEIDVSALYLLSAPSTPPEYREEILKRANAGERMTYSKVKAQTAAWRKASAASEAAEKQAKQQRKEAAKQPKSRAEVQRSAVTSAVYSLQSALHELGDIEAAPDQAVKEIISLLDEEAADADEWEFIEKDLLEDDGYKHEYYDDDWTMLVPKIDKAIRYLSMIREGLLSHGRIRVETIKKSGRVVQIQRSETAGSQA